MSDDMDNYRFPTSDDAPPPPRYRGPQDVPYLVRWLLLNDAELQHELWRDRNNVGRLVDEITGDTVRYRHRRSLELQLVRLYDQYRAARHAARTGHQQAALDEVVFGGKLRILQYIYNEKYGSFFNLADAQVPLQELYENWQQLTPERREILGMLRTGDFAESGEAARESSPGPKAHLSASVAATSGQQRRVRLYDISVPLAENTWAWPGDVGFTRRWTGHPELNDEGDEIGANVSAYTFSAHLGTHVDAPLHVGEEDTDVSELPLDVLWGACHVVTVGPQPIITANDLLDLPVRLADVERLVIHTGAGDGAREAGSFPLDFPAIDPDAAQLLVDNDIVLYGVDTPSVDSIETVDLPNHHILTRNGVLILEGLCLAGVPDGEYELVALPLKIRGGDGSPVRAVLRSRQ